jgi:hypothetical protein
MEGPISRSGEDASVSAVSSEVVWRRQVWESELQQFHSERRQGHGLEERGGNVSGGPGSGMHTAAEVAIDDSSLNQGAATADDASSLVLRGRGRCKASSVISNPSAIVPDQLAVQFPVLMKSPFQTLFSLVCGPELNSIALCPSVLRAAPPLSLFCNLLFRDFFSLYCNLICVKASSPAFCVCFRIKCTSGTLSLVSGGRPFPLRVKPFDVATLSAANLPCVFTLDSSVDGVKVVMKSTGVLRPRDYVCTDCLLKCVASDACQRITTIFTHIYARTY